MHKAGWSFTCVAGLAALAAGSARGQTNESVVALPNPQPAAAPTAAQPADLGEDTAHPWRTVYRVSGTIIHDDNIYITPTNRRSDFSLDLSPAFAIGYGDFRTELADFADIPHLLAQTGEEDLPRRDYAFFSYAPEGVLYLHEHGADALNHDARIAVRKEANRTLIEGGFHFTRETAPNLDLGLRATTNEYTANASAEYALTGKLTGKLQVDGDRTEFTRGLWSEDGHVTASVLDEIAPKTTLGLGVAEGRLDVESGSNQNYSQPLLFATYQATAKIALDGQAGEEFRRYDNGAPSRSRFVFRLGAGYQAREGTTLSLSGQRKTDSSAEYSGQNMIETVGQLSLRQRIGLRNYFGAAAGYERVNYQSYLPTTVADRRDDYAFGRVSLSRDLTEHGSLQFSYEHRRNDSTVPGFEFRQNLLALGATWLY